METSTRLLLTPTQLAEQVGMTVGALAQLRYRGIGPKYLKLGGRAVRYRQDDVDEWITAAERTRTDDRSGAA